MKLKPINDLNPKERETYEQWNIDEQMDYENRVFNQELNEYIKEYNRLYKKHGDNRKITREELMNNPYFLDDMDSITWTGGKNMAQYNAWNTGVCSEDEVEMWKK